MAQENVKKDASTTAKDIETAIKQFNDRSTTVQKTTDYYRGEHDLKFATDKFKNTFGNLFKSFALNVCPAICDAVRDKLVITGFRVESDGEGGSEVKDLPKEAWKIWQANRMGVRSGEIHKEASINGDAYAIVWVDDMKQVTIYPNKSANVTVFYDEESPGKILWAAKHWQTPEKLFRLNMYYPDRIERLVSKKKSEDGKLPEAKEFVEFEPAVSNPYGIVPVFHFANNGSIGGFGVSELHNAMPVQDALNKSVLDMLVTMEFASYRQRWASGIEIEIDDEGKAKPPFTAGVEKLWITENAETKFGDFEVTDLEQFLKVKDGFRTDIATVTGTPLHYFMLTGASFPQSGISIEKLESRFLGKIRDRMESYGSVWENLMSFALMIENKGKGVRLFTEWQDPAPLSEKEQLDNIVVKKDLGITERQALIEAGYGEEDVDEMLLEKQEIQQKMVQSFNAGENLSNDNTDQQQTDVNVGS
ncbi:MAG: phage portal protein [Acidobacteria bacterium]|nr:phage portal protein [Acidobacteriota bacterium]